uniref:Uncharacterized protein n=1 Tax=Ciona savignyi TaxID=51511 RepID=H2YR60_CIOSA
MSKKSALHGGDGSVTISFIGYACCGPIVVYIAMCFVAGIICAMLVVFMAYRCFKCVNRYRSGDHPLWGKTKKGFYSVFKGNKEIKTFGTMNNESRYPDRSYENNRDTIPRERSYSYDHHDNHDREKVRRDRSRERRRERRRRRYSSSSHEADVHDRDHRNSRRDTRDSRDQRRRERRRRSLSSDN